MTIPKMIVFLWAAMALLGGFSGCAEDQQNPDGDDDIEIDFIDTEDGEDAKSDTDSEDEDPDADFDTEAEGGDPDTDRKDVDADAEPEDEDSENDAFHPDGDDDDEPDEDIPGEWPEAETDTETEAETGEEEETIPFQSCMRPEFQAPTSYAISIAKAKDRIVLMKSNFVLKPGYRFSMAVYDPADPSAEAVEMEHDVRSLRHAPHDLLAATDASGNLLFFRPETFDTSTDPVNKIECSECDFGNLCFSGTRAFWLSRRRPDTSWRVMSAAVDPDGGFIDKTYSEYFKLLEDQEYHISEFSRFGIICSENHVIVGERTERLSMNGTTIEWELAHLPVAEDGAFGEAAVLARQMGTGLLQARLWRAQRFVSRNRLLIDFQIDTVHGMMSQHSFIDKSVFDLSAPGAVSLIGEHELSLADWFTLKNDTVWALSDSGSRLNRLTLLDDLTLDPVGSLEGVQGLSGLDTDGDTAWLALKSYGIKGVEFREGSEPEILFEKQLAMESMPVLHIFKDGERLFIVDSDHRLRRFDESHPLVSTYSIDVGFNPKTVLRKENRVYLLAYSYDSLLLAIVDIRLPQEQALLFSGRVDLPLAQARGYKGISVLEGDILYTAHRHLYAIDTSDPAHPELLWEIAPYYFLEPEGRFNVFESVQIVNGYLAALAEDDDFGYRSSLLVFQPNGAREPSVLGILEDFAEAMIADGNRLITLKKDEDHVTFRVADFSGGSDPAVSEPIHRYDIGYVPDPKTYRVLFMSGGYLVVSTDSMHLIDPGDVTRDIYAIPRFFNLNDFHPDDSGEGKFWISLDMSYYTQKPSGFYKVDISACLP